MKATLTLAATLIALSQSANAAGIFVQPAQGSGLQPNQAQLITDSVKQSVSSMPEHTLVQSEDQADFVLRPTVMQTGSEMRLRLEKLKDGQVMSTSDEKIASLATINDNAMTATQTAMQNDDIADSSSSATTMGASESPDAGSLAPSTGTSTDTAGTTQDSMSNTTTESTLSQSAQPSQPAPIDQDTASGTTSSQGSVLGSSQSSPESSLTSPGTSLSSPDTSMATSDNSTITGGTTFNDTTSGTTSEESNLDTQSGATTGDQATAMSPSEGQSTAQAPQSLNGRRGPGYVSIGAGPSFALGLNQDDIMIDINAGYNYDVSDRLTAKAFTDLNLSAGSDAGRFWNWAIGADVYPTTASFGPGRPYLTGDVGYAFTRANETNSSADGIAIGAGAGYKLATQRTNIDVNLHYSLLTTENDGENPSVLGLRAALNF